MKKVQVEVLGLSQSPTSNGSYALILKEIDGDRRLPIVIGAPEAGAIAYELEGVHTLDNLVSYNLEAISRNNTVGLRLQTQGYISQSEFSIKKYPSRSTYSMGGYSLAGNTVFENKDPYSQGNFVFLEKDIRSFYNGGETRITPNSVSIGIASTANVSHSLEVNGTAKIGTTGNKITAITNYDRVTTFSNLPSGVTQTVLFNLTNITKARNTVMVSPNVALPLGLSIASAMVSSDDWIEVRFTNTSTSTISLPMTSFNFTVFTF